MSVNMKFIMKLYPNCPKIKAKNRLMKFLVWSERPTCSIGDHLLRLEKSVFKAPGKNGDFSSRLCLPLH